MDNILATLNESQLTVDLGCGAGSFNYMSYRCRIVGIDLKLDPAALPRNGSRIGYIQSSSEHIPLADQSVDAVICNHTLEHFINYQKTLQEIGRVLKPDGFLWISVPNGFGFDDALYRLLFSGGGHVNRFTFQSLVDGVREATGLPLLQSAFLYSSFIYVMKLDYRRAVMGLNLVTRMMDKLVGTHLSLYGWGFIFSRNPGPLAPLPSFFNVCCNCGSGDAVEHLEASGRVHRRYGLTFYECSRCRQRNVFVAPPPGLL